MGMYSAPSDFDYWDEVNPPERHVMLECARCGDPIEWPIADGPPLPRVYCHACEEQMQNPTDATKARTTAIIQITAWEETKTRNGGTYWRCFGHHGLETLSMGTYQRDHAERLKAAQDAGQPALVTWAQKVRFDHPILKVVYPVPTYAPRVSEKR